MSRVGKQNLIIPEKTTVTVADGVLTVSGPLGNLSRPMTSKVTVAVEGNVVSFTPESLDPKTRALWGTYASHTKNMIRGVNAPYSKKLILEGVGFKSEVKGDALHLALGFSHPVVVAIPSGITVAAEKNVITITGIDKETVGQFAASVRHLKEAEPYKGKGFRYEQEVVRRKVGKKTA